jgi:hypothetical protein
VLRLQDPEDHEEFCRVNRIKRAAAEMLVRTKVRVDQEMFRARRASALPGIAARIKQAAKDNPRLVSNPDSLSRL